MIACEDSGSTLGALAGSATPAIMPETDGALVVVRHGVTNNWGGSQTFCLNGWSAKPILRDHGIPLAQWDLGETGRPLMMQYNATKGAWILLNPAVARTEVATGLVVRDATQLSDGSDNPLALTKVACGFRPSAVMLVAMKVDTQEVSIGWSHPDFVGGHNLTGSCATSYPGNPRAWTTRPAAAYLYQSTATAMLVQINNYEEDGFTLAWEESYSGYPYTGVYRVSWMAFR